MPLIELHNEFFMILSVARACPGLTGKAVAVSELVWVPGGHLLLLQIRAQPSFRRGLELSWINQSGFTFIYIHEHPQLEVSLSAGWKTGEKQ